VTDLDITAGKYWFSIKFGALQNSEGSLVAGVKAYRVALTDIHGRFSTHLATIPAASHAPTCCQGNLYTVVVRGDWPSSLAHAGARIGIAAISAKHELPFHDFSPVIRDIKVGQLKTFSGLLKFIVSNPLETSNILRNPHAKIVFGTAIAASIPDITKEQVIVTTIAQVRKLDASELRVDYTIKTPCAAPTITNPPVNKNILKSSAINGLKAAGVDVTISSISSLTISEPDPTVECVPRLHFKQRPVSRAGALPPCAIALFIATGMLFFR
jgi:hypothetical protein